MEHLNNASSQTENYKITHKDFLFQGDRRIIPLKPFPIFLGGPK